MSTFFDQRTTRRAPCDSPIRSIEQAFITKALENFCWGPPGTCGETEVLPAQPIEQRSFLAIVSDVYTVCAGLVVSMFEAHRNKHILKSNEGGFYNHLQGGCLDNITCIRHKIVESGAFRLHIGN